MDNSRWVFVPEQPTDAMWSAGMKELGEAGEVWSAMIAARPAYEHVRHPGWTERGHRWLDAGAPLGGNSGEPTPGPWVASNQHSGGGWRVETDAAGWPNAGWVVVSQMEGPDAEANARLIAAAPDLLDALKAALPVLDRHAEHEVWSAALAAISRALSSDTGEGK